MPFDSTPIQPNPHKPNTREWGEYNLELLASYLATGDTEHLFDMYAYGSPHPSAHCFSKRACAAGHLPYATHVEPKRRETWTKYVFRVSNMDLHNREHEHLMGFLFTGAWSGVSIVDDETETALDTPYRAADRIAFALDNRQTVMNLGSNIINIDPRNWLDYFEESGRQPGKLEGYEYPDVTYSEETIARDLFSRESHITLRANSLLDSRRHGSVTYVPQLENA